MDSITQIMLGATVSHSVLGGHIGRKALVVGAALGTLPDLDVLVRYEDAVASFTYHRSWSHSLFVLSLISLPVAWLLSRFKWKVEVSLFRWWLASFLVLITHPLLDAMTIYGTQLFWPLPVQPVSIGSIFIIDPLYTLPLIIGVVCAWRWQAERAHKAVVSALAISCLYLVWTLVAQHFTEQRVHRSLAEANISAREIVIAPFPTTILWRALVISDNRYYEGFTSLLDRKDQVHLAAFDNGHTQYAEWLPHWPVERLQWFTRGATALSVENEELVVTDLRMGVEGSYVFRFSVARLNTPREEMPPSRQLPMQFSSEQGRLLLQRITDQDIVVSGSD